MSTAPDIVLLEIPYSSTNTYVWTPTLAEVYTLTVWAKASASTTTTFDQMTAASFVIN